VIPLPASPRRRREIRIYTGTGDYGKTSLFSGERVSKREERVEALGDVDELGAVLGMLASMLPEEDSRSFEEIERIQRVLFKAGALLATTPDSPSFALLEAILEEDIRFLEAAIDRMDDELPELKLFILPGGHAFAAWAHMARTVCRRAERHGVHLFEQMVSGEQKEKIRGVVVFLNRLSDYLFVLARHFNRVHGVEERVWSR
jgi:cob(I)alamin adenosyltransferase